MMISKREINGGYFGADEDIDREYVLDDIAEDIHRTAISKGWWDEDRNAGEMIALIHSEVSEVLEVLRHGNPPDDKIPEFNGAVVELADVVIRCLDMS